MLRFFWMTLKNLATGFRSVRCRRKQRLMHLCETLPLGDRRYLALVEVEGQKFLVGAAGNSLSLLARLISPPEPLPRAESGDIFDAEEFKTWR